MWKVSFFSAPIYEGAVAPWGAGSQCTVFHNSTKLFLIPELDFTVFNANYDFSKMMIGYLFTINVFFIIILIYIIIKCI